MRFRTVFCVVSLFLLGSTVAAWSGPISDRLVPTNLNTSTDNQSLSGKISSVGDAAFSLEVTKGQERTTVEFFIDGDTKVEGKLDVGSLANVEYHANHGKNIAVHVVVTPNSGKSGH